LGLRRLLEAPPAGRQRRHADAAGGANEAEQRTPQQIAPVPQRLAGHDVIENQARQEQVHAEVEQRPVGLLVEHAAPPHHGTDGHEQKEGDDAAQNFEVLLHRNCKQSRMIP